MGVRSLEDLYDFAPSVHFKALIYGKYLGSQYQK